MCFQVSRLSFSIILPGSCSSLVSESSTRTQIWYFQPSFSKQCWSVSRYLVFGWDLKSLFEVGWVFVSTHPQVYLLGLLLVLVPSAVLSIGLVWQLYCSLGLFVGFDPRYLSTVVWPFAGWFQALSRWLRAFGWIPKLCHLIMEEGLQDLHQSLINHNLADEWSFAVISKVSLCTILLFQGSAGWYFSHRSAVQLSY